ncbi:MAG: EAL domain-containing protein [Rhodoferax sp.]|jgi:diguanylate cyclase (GGDEF)-like protein/PAS domain S-box-containing protein|uniref:EAL domain-containing protein n=1 Tax=Rhodoferax sp. TaxID=50421 RepID=UPI001B45446A|nr:EAL domain-containing protein [Rhodoferax sp.]MBP9147979.1 EAL domain-containing protein [Rhodoferax sp.]MBP9734101.1 EAL domain-containing protein [Rhodoferax sp.]
MPVMLRVFRLITVLCCLLLAGVALAAQGVRIGVLSFQGKPETLAQWAPTAQWLSQKLPQYQFEMLPLNYEELDAAVDTGSIDFVLTNPEHYIVLRNRHQLRPMVTLNMLINGRVVEQFGSVIFTRAETPIATLESVVGKRVAAVSVNSLGGFLMAADIFQQAGVQLLDRRQAEMVYLGLPHSQIVEAVKEGKADVGIVRTGVLESMQSQGKVDLSQLRIINAQHNLDFPQLLSTDLYPEWPWTALRHTPKDLVKATTLALLQVPADSAAARSGRYQGFSTPANYTVIENLMRRVNVYPGMRERPVWQVLWTDHQAKIILLAGALLVTGLTMAAYFWRSNRRLRELTRVNQEAQASLEVAAAAFDSQVGLVVTDDVACIKLANQAMSALLGYLPQELTGQMTQLLRSDSVPEFTMRKVWQDLQLHGRWQGELTCQHKNGRDVPCMVTISAIRHPSSGLRGYVGSFTDITDRKRAESHIRELAYFDPLTQLPNRRMFLEALQTAMNAALQEGTLAGIMFIDLDFFKNLNDAHGHSVGDQLLSRIAQRLMLIIGQHDMAARLGGDEFVVMLTHLDTSESVAMEQTLAMAQAVHQALLSPFELDTASDFGDHAQTLRYTCSGSIGVALFGLLEEPLTEVLKRADVAMYKAKHDGRNLIRQYDPQAQKAVNERMALSNDLNLALRDGQLSLLYQLQVDARNQAVGAECLMRWEHPVRGKVSPVEFIPLAEDSGAIIAMGDWVVRSACETLTRWAAMPTMAALSLSVNVSPRQFTEADFVERVAKIVAETGARAELLRLEVTEGIVMQDTRLVIDRMQELCAMGLSFSIDDFGTGYSSLSYMQMLPLAEIKIDKTFVNDLTSNERSAAIVKAVIALGNSMNITIVSEGVETQAQKDQLLALGCTLLQGYLISRPIARESLEELVALQNQPQLAG